MRAGRPRFGGGTIASILARRLVTDPPPLCEASSTVPPQVERVILKALKRDPGERFQSAAELRAALIGIRHVVPMIPVSTLTRGQTGLLSRWPRARSATLAMPRLPWNDVRTRMSDGAAVATAWASVAGRGARTVAGTAVPAAMTRAQLLTPTHRPTLRA